MWEACKGLYCWYIEIRNKRWYVIGIHQEGKNKKQCKKFIGI